MLFSALAITLFSTSFIGAHAGRTYGDHVDLSYGKFQGYNNETSGLTYFLGIPYAAAPVGPLRFNVPHPPPSSDGVKDATKFGAACIQQTPQSFRIGGSGPFSLGAVPKNQSEDCLFVNVIRPINLTSAAPLPVLFWIFGGGFQFGDSAGVDATRIVQRSLALGEPIIVVSVNYRLNAYGFLASKEVKEAGLGNLGLRDQRFALKWVQQNIHLFGGDKTKVTLWGESAGAISAGIHLTVNDGKPDGLYRGAFMNSGSPPAAADITAGQGYYDLLVNETGCAGSANTLECLRGVPHERITDVVTNKTPNLLSFQSLQLAYEPRVDGDFIKENPQDSIAKGAYAKVPFVTGDCYDEGTFFISDNKSRVANLTTSAELLDYIHQNYFPNANAMDIETSIGRLYPEDPSKGSPFGTGNETNIYPQYKRIAAFVGDLNFQSPRRYFLEAASKTQNTWAFIYRRYAGQTAFPAVVGVYHTSDALSFGFANGVPARDTQGIDALVNFVNHLNPTRVHPDSSLSIQWPTWGSSDTRPALTFWDSAVLNVTSDTDRGEQIQVLTELTRRFPLGSTELPVRAD